MAETGTVPTAAGDDGSQVSLTRSRLVRQEVSQRISGALRVTSGHGNPDITSTPAREAVIQGRNPIAPAPSISSSTTDVEPDSWDEHDNFRPEQIDLANLAPCRKWCIFTCSCFLQFLLNFDMASVAVTLPSIAKDLQASQVLVFTVATGYFLAQTVFQLPFSHTSHAVGRKYAYLTGVTLHIIGAIVAAASKSAQQLIAARIVQGIGAAGMFTMSAIVIVDLMQPRQRASWTAVSQACGALGNICGPLFAALLFKQYTWRSIFYLEFIAAGVLFAVLLGLLPNGRNRSTAPLKVLKSCDWIGMFLFFVSSVTILIPINIGGTVQPWRSPVVIACLLVGMLSLLVLICHQRDLMEHPAFPRQVFTKSVTNVAFFGSFVSGMLLSMIFYNLVLFWEGVRHLPTIKVGIMLLAVTLSYTASAATTGVAIRFWGRIKWATITGTVLAEIGLGLMYLLTETAPVGPLIVITMLAATGCGMYLPAMINTILASTEREWHSHAIAMRTLLYTAGQCMGISIGVAIFTNNFSYQVDKVSHGSQSVAITPQSLMQIIKDLPKDSEIVTLIVMALRWVWGAAAVIGLLAGIPSCVLKCPALPEDDEVLQLEEERRQAQSSRRRKLLPLESLVPVR
ncbi:hypothetical protein N0V93_001561 [Gnomoniopsis smithogilvyi]|uniref:Major facilitator superfamily (MFS) profile domain-containing protein n=1 Tax=Gnomoniopsis smithogilvyi TaxID=1191159 RepID=A0A9W8Z3R6_9PEZI|nr:hypothetical protein N0V93_001561 [Gnomoniopsis smithogilvyi]